MEIFYGWLCEKIRPIKKVPMVSTDDGHNVSGLPGGLWTGGQLVLLGTDECEDRKSVV